MTAWSLADAWQERWRHATGTPVDRDVRQYTAFVERIDAVGVAGLSDADLQHKARAIRGRHDRGESADDLLPEVFAIVREASSRLLGLRPFDVQLAAGV